MLDGREIRSLQCQQAGSFRHASSPSSERGTSTSIVAADEGASVDANRIVVDSVVRYPVKGLAGVPTGDPVRLEPGRGLRWDRSFAIAREASTPDNPGWRPREDFFHLARHEHIARIAVDLADAETTSPILTVTTADGEAASGRLGADTASVSAGIDDLLRRTLDRKSVV